MKLKNNFWWSSISLAVGSLGILIGFVSPEKVSSDIVAVSVVVTAGAIAYISLKKRRLSKKRRTLVNLIVEIIGLGIVCIPIIGIMDLFFELGINLTEQFAYYTYYLLALYLLIPLWCVGAYIVAYNGIGGAAKGQDTTPSS